MVIDGVGAPDSHAYDATVWVIAGYVIFHVGLALLVTGCMGRAGPPAPCRPGGSESCGSCGYGPTMPRWLGWAGRAGRGMAAGGLGMRDILRTAAPFTLWIAAFSAVYGLEGMVCSRHGLALGRGQGRLLLVT